MATQKLQVGRAIPVIPSNNCDIPFPAIITGGTNTYYSGSEFGDGTKDFQALGVQAGDIVYNNSGLQAATVVRLINSYTIELNSPIFEEFDQQYIIFNGGNNDGSVLYVGSSGDLRVTTVGGDVVSLVGVSGGQFLPIHITKVWYSGTSASNIVALW
jgi:hypothetical protein